MRSEIGPERRPGGRPVERANAVTAAGAQSGCARVKASAKIGAPTLKAREVTAGAAAMVWSHVVARELSAGASLASCDAWTAADECSW
jgi:hypothetical protein